MTDRAQFEAMLEALINEDHDQAKEIFHNIVVGKSREIYEELLESDFGSDTGNPYAKGADSADESVDDADSEDDSEDDSEEGDDEEGDDDSDMEDRVMDLEDALEDLKAEFEQLLAGEEGEEHMGGDMDSMGGDMDSMGGDMGGDDMEDESMGLMEYVNKVPSPKHGDNGTNTRSIVAGKNDMGGSSNNIAQSFSTEKGSTTGGLAKNTAGDLTSGLGEIHNRPGSTSAGSKGFKKQVKGGGIDRQSGFDREGSNAGTGGGDNGTKNTKSVISKRVR